MTQAELDALPECGGIGIEPMPGMPGVNRPVVRENFVLGDAELVIDGNGDGWMVGWANGIRYKRFMRPLL